MLCQCYQIEEGRRTLGRVMTRPKFTLNPYNPQSFEAFDAVHHSHRPPYALSPDYPGQVACPSPTDVDAGISRASCA